MLSIPLGKKAIKVMNLRCPMHPICKEILRIKLKMFTEDIKSSAVD